MHWYVDTFQMSKTANEAFFLLIFASPPFFLKKLGIYPCSHLFTSRFKRMQKHRQLEMLLKRNQTDYDLVFSLKFLSAEVNQNVILFQPAWHDLL